MSCTLILLPLSIQVDVGFGYATFTAPIDAKHVKEDLVMLGLPYAEKQSHDLTNALVLLPAMRRPGSIWIEVNQCSREALFLVVPTVNSFVTLLFCR